MRAVGVVYLIIFSGIIDEGAALVGPRGIAPISAFLRAVGPIIPAAPLRLLVVPSLFWFSSSQAMIVAMEWGGALSAVALVLNLWPRMALFLCWSIFLSFVSTWQLFTSAIVDPLMLEVALISIPFAPAGFFPGLGARSPPRPIALFAVRWLLLRLMFLSGLAKIAGNDPHWRNLTAMEVMFETSPLPTYFGYLAHLIPHVLQLGEIVLTFTAEILAPLAALFCGRFGRWFAFVTWVALQAGIELTSSFGWLNFASIAWAILLLDDRMLSDVGKRLRLGGVALCAGASDARPSGFSNIPKWKLYGLRLILSLQIVLTVYFSGKIWADKGSGRALRFVDYLFRDFYSANAYVPYGSFPSEKDEVEFIGSNDGGRTWRTYEFKFKPQRTDHICAFVAPWYPRFEASLQYAVRLKRCLLIPRVSALLIGRNPAVMSLFANDPFPDRPATIVRMPVYRYSFTDLETHRRSGDYWKKAYICDYMPPVYVSADGRIAE